MTPSAPAPHAAQSAEPRPGDAERRLVVAALRCVARWGLAKTTLDDVAREAGCSRATVYRAFPGGKEALFDAVLQTEVAAAFDALRAAIEEANTLDDALVAAIVAAGRRILGHAALQFLLAHEPEVVLPHLAFTRMDALLAQVAAFAGPLLERFLADEAESERLAEWVSRLVLSYTCSPSPGVDLTDAASVRRLVTTFVLPGLPVPTS